MKPFETRIESRKSKSTTRPRRKTRDLNRAAYEGTDEDNGDDPQSTPTTADDGNDDGIRNGDGSSEYKRFRRK